MKNLYKPIHKRVCVILTLVLLSVALTGCTIPISFNMPSNSAMTIPKTAFSQSADTTEEIVQLQVWIVIIMSANYSLLMRS